jgi:hypothetical protein
MANAKGSAWRNGIFAGDSRLWPRLCQRGLSVDLAYLILASGTADYQSPRQTEADIRHLFGASPSNIGTITGAVVQALADALNVASETLLRRPRIIRVDGSHAAVIAPPISGPRRAPTPPRNVPSLLALETSRDAEADR